MNTDTTHGTGRPRWPERNPLETMRAFVKQQGGEVRYDVFANEHLMGASGFYRSYLDISIGGDVQTPTQSDPEYRTCLAGLVVGGFLQAYSNTCREKGAPPVIVEVGGGGGQLKREVCGILKNDNIPHRYISVEPNATQRAHQRLAGTEVMNGVVTKLPFPDSSIDFLFDEEVLDCLPVRVFKWDRTTHRIVGELFVRCGKTSLEHFWKEPDPNDERIGHIKCDLKRVGYKPELYYYAAGYWDYVMESARVLKPGGIRLGTDYGFIGCPENTPFPEFNRPIFSELGYITKAVKEPYTCDLTHFVDFVLLQKLAGLQQAFSSTKILPLMNAFAEVSEQAAMRGMDRFAFIAQRK